MAAEPLLQGIRRQSGGLPAQFRQRAQQPRQPGRPGRRQQLGVGRQLAGQQLQALHQLAAQGGGGQLHPPPVSLMLNLHGESLIRIAAGLRGPVVQVVVKLLFRVRRMQGVEAGVLHEPIRQQAGPAIDAGHQAAAGQLLHLPPVHFLSGQQFREAGLIQMQIQQPGAGRQGGGAGHEHGAVGEAAQDDAGFLGDAQQHPQLIAGQAAWRRRGHLRIASLGRQGGFELQQMQIDQIRVIECLLAGNRQGVRIQPGQILLVRLPGMAAGGPQGRQAEAVAVLAQQGDGRLPIERPPVQIEAEFGVVQLQQGNHGPRTCRWRSSRCSQ